MKALSKKSLFIQLPMLLLVLAASNAFATGGRSDGGGDICEDRIKLIRDDLKSWISKGGAEGLTLPQGISSDEYAALMLTQIKNARIDCVGQGDEGYPVKIGRTPKVCKFSIDAAGAQITCDYVKLLVTDESRQYVLIHHEYAGLAGIEVPDQDDSHYETSNQISGYLENQVVKKLAVKSVASSPSYKKASFCMAYGSSGPEDMGYDYEIHCSDPLPSGKTELNGRLLFFHSKRSEETLKNNVASEVLASGYKSAGQLGEGVVYDLFVKSPDTTTDQRQRCFVLEDKIEQCSQGVQLYQNADGSKASAKKVLSENGFTLEASIDFPMGSKTDIWHWKVYSK